MNDQVLEKHHQILTMHKLKLSKELQVKDSDQQDLLMHEIALVNGCENWRETQRKESESGEQTGEETKEVKMIKM